MTITKSNNKVQCHLKIDPEHNRIEEGVQPLILIILILIHHNKLHNYNKIRFNHHRSIQA